MNGVRYRGSRRGSSAPFAFLCAGLALGVISAAVWLFAPAIGFLALLGGCGAAALMLYAMLCRLAQNGVYGGPARAAMLAIKILLLIFLATFAAGEVYIASGSGSTVDSAGADCLIVLGAGVNGETPSLMLASRLEKALEYLGENPKAVAILSGGQGKGESVTEAEAMRRWLEARGIAAERLILEAESANTVFNIRNSFALAREHFGDSFAEIRICVLTNDFHLRRARLIAEHEGRYVGGISARTPRLDLSLCYYVREYFALAKALLIYMFI